MWAYRKRRLRGQKGLRPMEQSQRQAIQFVRDAAQGKSPDAWSTLKTICERSNRPYRLIEDAIKTMMNEGHIALHFHPDRCSNRVKRLRSRCAAVVYTRISLSRKIQMACLRPMQIAQEHAGRIIYLVRLTLGLT